MKLCLNPEWSDYTAWPPLAVPSIRLWDALVTWQDIEKTAGNYDFSVLDDRLKVLAANGITDFLYTAGKLPAFYSVNDAAKFGAFVSALAAHIATVWNGTWTFEQWNEPNLGQYWTGSAAQLLVLSRTAYAVLKPLGVQVLSPSGSGGTAVGSFILSYLTACAKDYPFDIFAYHCYLGDKNPDPTTGLGLILNDIKVKKQTYGISAMETWLTEGSWGRATDYTPNLSDLQTSVWLIKAIPIMGKSVARFYHYAFTSVWGTLATGTPPILNLTGQTFNALLIGGSVPTTSTVNIPVPASQVTAPAVSVPVPPTSVPVTALVPASSVMAPPQSVPVPASQVQITVVDATVNAKVKQTWVGNTLTLTDAGSDPPPPPPVKGIIGWLGNDALAGTLAVGQKVVVGASAGPVRSGGFGSAAPVSPQPVPKVGATVTVLAGPSGIYWQVQFPDANTPPNPSPPDPPPSGVRVAFPGAQGGGALAVGGRGGAVFEVTNLNDSGAGSLRAALQASGARTVVFRMAGNIAFLSRAQVSSPFLTIAGQTAPGSGIVIGGPNQKGEQIFISTHDVVCRYLTYDGNNPNTPTGPDTGTVGFELASGDIYNCVFDHISARWMGNKVFPVMSNVAGKGVHNLSFQWCLIAEPNVQHAVGIGTVYATEGSGMQTTDNDCHHCAFITVDHRLPLNQSGRNVRWVSNIIFNWGQFAALSMGGVQTDYLHNDYVDSSGGNLNYSSAHVFLGEPGNANDAPGDWPNGDNLGPPSFYLLGNRGRVGTKNAATGGSYVQPTLTPNDAGQLSMCAQGTEAGDSGSPMPSSWIRSTPLPAQPAPITADPVNTLDAVLLPTVGNSQMIDANGNWVARRDREDTRILAYYKARTTGNNLFTGQYSAPPTVAGTPYPSSQHDGLSDIYKQAMGLDTSKPQNNFVMPDGLTALDWFLAGRKA